MKKLLICFLTLALMVSLCACAAVVLKGVSDAIKKEDQTPAKISSADDAADGTEENIKFSAGDKIETDDMDITINSIELSYDVLPDDTSSFYKHYPADSGHVYIVVDADVFNKSKRQIECDEIGEIVADYNDGYRYSGFIAAEDSS